jgi:O-acetyl-ADP-ribose deacetylase (regulator of RNase III)
VLDIQSRVSVVTGDITALDVDAIVNAANSSLLGGGGVDGAIHRAAGPELLEECRGLNGCPTGEARLTAGHRLKAKHIIHTVGPVWRGDPSRPIGENPEDDLLARSYTNSLVIATGVGIQRLAFPAISTGVYAFPKERAAEIAVASVAGFLSASSTPDHVVFCAFSPDAAQVLQTALDTLLAALAG